MRNILNYSMLESGRWEAETEKDLKVIEEHIDEEIGLFVDYLGRVWNEGGKWVANIKEVE